MEDDADDEADWEAGDVSGHSPFSGAGNRDDGDDDQDFAGKTNQLTPD